jgi:hypothetical protein
MSAATRGILSAAGTRSVPRLPPGLFVLREDSNGSLAPSWPSSALDEQRNSQSCRGTWYIQGRIPTTFGVVIGLFIWALIDDQRQRSFVTGYPGPAAGFKDHEDIRGRMRAGRVQDAVSE